MLLDTATLVAVVGVGVTIIVLLIRGSYALGKSTAQVESLSAQVNVVRTEIGEVRTEARQDNQQLRAELRLDVQELREELKQDIREARAEARQDNQQLRAEMNAGFASLAGAIDALRVETQQSNQMLAALANHTHDTDGRTVFAVPPPPARQ